MLLKLTSRNERKEKSRRGRKERKKEDTFSDPLTFTFLWKEKKINCLIRIISEWHGGEDLPVFYHSNNYFRSIIGKEARNNRLSTPIKEYTCGIGSLRRERAARAFNIITEIDRSSINTDRCWHTHTRPRTGTHTNYTSTHSHYIRRGRCVRESERSQARKRGGKNCPNNRSHCRSGRSCTGNHSTA